MQKTENKTTNSVRSKLVAAIAMLLVATIMVVSSTYAWFTLSTKPEVSGISTAVGANGALEIALATQDESGNVTFGEGDVSGATPAQRNTHWGNLVDLSLKEYGSGSIVLYPSILNVNPDTNTIVTDLPIKTPTYGADGRVNGVKPSGLFAMFDTADNVFMKSDNYGFRAIGNASGLSPRQQAFRVALAQIMVNSASAQVKARNSLSTNGNTLASIAIKKAMVTDATYDKNDIAAVGSMIDGIEEALAAVEAAYLEIIYATIYSTELGLDDLTATAAANAAKAAAEAETSGNLGAKIAAVVAAAAKEGATTLDTTKLPSYTKFQEAVTNFTTAQTNHAKIATKTECTWTELSAALYLLVDVENITINGHIPTEVKNNTDTIVQDVLGGKGIVVVIPTGGGVFADVADYAGDYTVGITINTADLKLGVNAGPVDATMKADATDAPILSAAKVALGQKEPAGDAGKTAITEFYGYAIDLGFRTNASTSNLLLKTTPADRIYKENQNEETMGKGSTMTFATTDATFTKDKMLNLMSKLKVVFYDTKTTEILAYAKLDTNANKVTGTAVDGITANLYIEGENNTLLEEKDAVITPLSPNNPKQITVLVYLDGENISNADVSAIASDARSMTGTFNLQFASSADLVPMEYSDLHTAAPAANNP